MSEYRAPLKDLIFVLNELADAGGLAGLPGFEDATPDVLEAILEEAGKLAGEVLAPLNRVGDQQGSKLQSGEVLSPEGFKDAYTQIVENGWLSLAQDIDFGGQGLPFVLHAAVTELWNSANMSFALCPMLTVGAVDALHTHADENLKATYLPKLVSGEWTGTMNLTEPQAGSDLAAVQSKAIPNGDHYLISGQKIFITWGEHQLTDNIVHLVLARLPDAPPGVKGISLFAVPKFLVDEDSSLGQRNDVKCVSLEHKLGIHASPTCVMSFGDEGGAVGYLIGEANNGLACMFTMMNRARLEVGLEGVGLSERAYQHAVAYARERVQGTAPGVEGRAAIIHHGDVRRMLMLMRSLTEATRAVALTTAADYDRSHKVDDAAAQKVRVELLTPIVKAWCTEVAQEVTSLGIQVHGGMGYIEETGCAQYYRDARIITIYEGTNGIQANDLVGRKTIKDRGAAMKEWLAEINSLCEAIADSGNTTLIQIGEHLSSAYQDAKTAVDQVLKNAEQPGFGNAVAVNYLMLIGTLAGGWQMARAAKAAEEKLAADGGDSDFYRDKLVTAAFYMEHILPRVKAYLAPIMAGSDPVMGIDPDRL